MSNIFDVQPPAWYQAIARPPGPELGRAIGTTIAGGVNALR